MEPALPLLFWFYNKCWGDKKSQHFFVKIMHLSKIPDKM